MGQICFTDPKSSEYFKMKASKAKCDSVMIPNWKIMSYRLCIHTHIRIYLVLVIFPVLSS